MSGRKRYGPNPPPRPVWSFEEYEADMNFPPDRLSFAREAVKTIESLVAQQGLPWTKIFRKGYIVFQRSGGYNVLGVDLMWRRPPRVWIKYPNRWTNWG